MLLALWTGLIRPGTSSVVSITAQKWLLYMYTLLIHGETYTIV